MEYQEDLKPWVGVRRAGKVALGHLDAQGNFIPQPRMEPIDPANPFSGPNYAVINEPARKDEPVYEYRSGSLIQGTLDKEGDFRPEVGSKVISFQDYLKGYNPQTSLRVYNLPGRLVAKAKKEADKE